MARPKKTIDADMVKIVDTFYENSGNADMLKCSLLEKFAKSIGLDIKAYDFRRSTAVRERIDELKSLSLFSQNAEAIAYKSLDTDNFINRNRTDSMLRKSLTELDASWRNICERAAETARKNEELKNSLKEEVMVHTKIADEKAALSDRIKVLNKSNRELMLENRYLKKMLKTYLYPAVANEILKQENVLEDSDTEVTREAVDKMIDSGIPLPFSNAIATDMAMISREESLLERIRNQIDIGDDDE
jgi:hypothetical protein